MNILLIFAALIVGIVENCPTGDAPIAVEDYVRAVRKAGETPVVICRTDDAAALRKVVSGVDLLILAGGEDVDPARYGEKPSPKLGGVNAVRDDFEWKLLEIAVGMEKPVLGICRGVQMMNVFFGGSLYQDIPSEFPAAASENHNCGEWTTGKRKYLHEIAIAPNSRLAAACGVTGAKVNSAHHQCVKRLAPGFRIAAKSSCGIIEAIESERYPAAGVQFHPEVLSADNDDAVCNRLFRNLAVFTGKKKSNQ